MINRRRESFRDVVSRTRTLNVQESSGAQGTLADELQYPGLFEGRMNEKSSVEDEMHKVFMAAGYEQTGGPFGSPKDAAKKSSNRFYDHQNGGMGVITTKGWQHHNPDLGGPPASGTDAASLRKHLGLTESDMRGTTGRFAELLRSHGWQDDGGSLLMSNDEARFHHPDYPGEKFSLGMQGQWKRIKGGRAVAETTPAALPDQSYKMLQSHLRNYGASQDARMPKGNTGGPNESKELTKSDAAVPSRRGFLGALAKKAATAPIQQALAQQVIKKSVEPSAGVHSKLPKSADHYRTKWGDRPTWHNGGSDVPQQDLEKWGQAKVGDGEYTSFPHLTPKAWWRLKSVGFNVDDGDANTLVRHDHAISFDHKTFTHDREIGFGKFQTFKIGHVKDLDDYILSDEFDDNLDK